MEKIKALKLEELESVSGGADLENNDEDRSLEFKNAWQSLGLSNNSGNMNKEYNNWKEAGFNPPSAFDYLLSLTK